MKIRTSKRNYIWVVQKKVGKRWNTLVDSKGIITIATRKLARDISREYKNTSRTPRSFRVARMAVK